MLPNSCYKKFSPSHQRSDQAARITFLSCTKLPNPGFILSNSHRGSLAKSSKPHLNWTAKGPKSWKPSICGKILSHQHQIHIVWLTHHFKKGLVQLRRLYPVHIKAIRIFGYHIIRRSPKHGQQAKLPPIGLKFPQPNEQLVQIRPQ